MLYRVKEKDALDEHPYRGSFSRVLERDAWKLHRSGRPALWRAFLRSGCRHALEESGVLFDRQFGGSGLSI